MSSLSRVFYCGGFVSGEMSIEELAAKYAGAYDSDFELPQDSSSEEDEDEDGAEQNSDGESGLVGDMERGKQKDSLAFCWTPCVCLGVSCKSPLCHHII